MIGADPDQRRGQGVGHQRGHGGNGDIGANRKAKQCGEHDLRERDDDPDQQAQRDAGLVTAAPAAGVAGAGSSAVDRPAPASTPAPAASAPTTPAPRLSRTLRVVEGPKAGQTIALEGRPLLMGRAQDADLVLVDDYASGRHARLFPQGTRWFLEDLGSTNGTYVNGAPVTRALPVGPGTAIRIGKTVMELEA